MSDAFAALLARAEAAGLLAAPDAVTTTADLGRGGNASVHLVRRGSGARAALKQAHNLDAASAGVLAELLHEVELLQACASCERVLRCFGLLATPTSVGLLLEEYGVSVATALHDPRLVAAESQRRTVARHLAEALAYLHDRARVVHLDIKPENVLVNPERGWAAKLADFGGAKRLTALQRHSLLERHSMTLAYCAPELLRRELPDELSAATPCLDVYAYGLTLYMLWLRTPVAPLPRFVRHPFRRLELDADNDDELAATVRDTFACLLIRRVGVGGERPPLAAAVPADIQELITACWAQDAATRPTAAALAAHATLARAQSWRAVVTVTYAPRVAGTECAMRVSVAPAALAGAGDAAQQTDDGEVTVSFICMLTTGTECVISVTAFAPPKTPHAGDGRWLATTTAVLLPNTPSEEDGLAASQPLAQCNLGVSVTRLDAATGEEAPAHLAACVLLERRHAVCAMPDVRLGTLSLSLADDPSAAAAPHYDVMLSYCDAETGVARGGDGFAPAVCSALRACGFSVYMFSDRVVEGKAWQDVRAFGVTRCAAVVAVTSPTFACFDNSPWSASELRMAFAERTRRGAPRFVALWHTGDAPPVSSAVGNAAGTALFRGQAELPDAVVPPPTNGRPGAACHFDDIVTQLVKALRDLDVHPGAAAPAAA